MLPIRRFSRLPLAWHLGLAALLLALAWLAMDSWVNHARRQLQDAHNQLAAMAASASVSARSKVPSPELAAPDFRQALPDRVMADAVLRDMGRHAQSFGINLSTVAVTHAATSPRELGNVQFSVSASGEYGKTKAWLAQLLARYATLAVQSLSMRAANDANVESQWVLTLFVKD